MSIYSECVTQIENALNAWDFTALFPSNWPAANKGVMILNKWPVDLIDNILKETGSRQMTMPIISITPQTSDAVFTGMGGYVTNISQTSGRPMMGMRAAVKLVLSAWADQALGGEEMSLSLAGELFDCMVYNCNRLPSYRRLRPSHSDTAYEDRPQLWVAEVLVEGVTVYAYEAVPLPTT